MLLLILNFYFNIKSIVISPAYKSRMINESVAKKNRLYPALNSNPIVTTAVIIITNNIDKDAPD